MTDPFMMGGIKILTSTMMMDYLPTGRPVRYSRKKRLQKKYLKKYGRRYVESPKTYLVEVKPGVMVGHPILVAQLRAQLAELEAGGANGSV